MKTFKPVYVGPNTVYYEKRSEESDPLSPWALVYQLFRPGDDTMYPMVPVDWFWSVNTVLKCVKYDTCPTFAEATEAATEALNELVKTLESPLDK